jgi:hypothetical protein
MSMTLYVVVLITETELSFWFAIYAYVFREEALCVAAIEADENRIENKSAVTDTKASKYSLFIFFINTTRLFNSKSQDFEYYNTNQKSL